MSIEKQFPAIPVQLFEADGNALGEIRVASTALFKVEQIVKVRSSTKQEVELQVKFIGSPTVMKVGRLKDPLDQGMNLSDFLVSDGASIKADVQPKPAKSIHDMVRGAWDEAPTNAFRTSQVDPRGNHYSVDNPFPVQLSNGSINIDTINAQLETFLTHKDNDPHSGDVHSSIRIGDGVDELKVNSDGSLNVVVQTSGSDLQIMTFNEVNAVPSGFETAIVSYTAPLSVDSYLNKIDYSGENVGKYSVFINGVMVDLQRSYFGSSLNGTFNFANGSKGLKLSPGDVVTLKVIHNRPSVGDFNGRIQMIQS